MRDSTPSGLDDMPWPRGPWHPPGGDRRRRSSVRCLALSCLFAFLALMARGADPVPVFAYDFSRVEDGVVPAGGNEHLALRVKSVEEGALLGGPKATPVDPGKAAGWLERSSPDEFSAAFWIRFDRLPSEGDPIGFFGVSADGEGLVSIRLFAKEGDFLGDFTMKARTPVEKGGWHHVEFSYSRIQRRAALYLDGAFQWENDNLHLPESRYGAPELGDRFAGAIRDLRCYDMALPSGYLAIARDVTSSCGDMAVRAQGLAGRTANPHLRTWLGELERKARSYAAAPGATTVAQVEELALDLGNAGKIVDAFSQGKELPGRVASSPVMVFTVKPLSQELFLPRTLPRRGRISGRIRMVAARGERENASALVFAFRPTTVRKVSVTDLHGPDGATIPSGAVDVKLVKRWFRSGGAWLSYHNDRRQRNLTPDLLVYDDDVIRVDEWRRRNYLRLDYPEGRRYVDVSDPAQGHLYWENDVPFRDAETLQPVRIPEAGRNQQFLFTLAVPDDAVSGIYRGRISFEGTDVSLALELRVLPFDLPLEPSTYYDLDKTVISHMNRLPEALGPTCEARKDYMRKLLSLLRSHNIFHMTGIWDSEELIDLSREAGLVPDKIFGVAAGYGYPGLEHECDWTRFYPGVPSDDLTSADKEAALRIIRRTVRPWQRYFKKNFPADAEPYVLFYSETMAFQMLNTRQGDQAAVAQGLGQKVFAHGWKTNLRYAGDIQDMHSVTELDDEADAAAWHAAGGELISYSDTFPGTENPYWFRRRIGLRTYKAGYDGEMLHGFLNARTPWNEFAGDPSGDGNYRNFAMILPQQDGYIAKLALEGVREAYDDLRYATRLRQLALANRDSEDEDLRRESRRQLLWLENLDGKTADLDMARLAMCDDICLLQELIRRRKGVLPPANEGPGETGGRP